MRLGTVGGSTKGGLEGLRPSARGEIRRCQDLCSFSRFVFLLGLISTFEESESRWYSLLTCSFIASMLVDLNSYARIYTPGFQVGFCPFPHLISDLRSDSS